MKAKRFILCLFSIVCLSSCSSSGDIKKMENKPYNGTKGNYIIVEKQKFKSPKLVFKGPGMITPNTKPEDNESKKDKFEKAEKQEYSNVKIEEKDGKKYITAKDFKYKLVVVDENTIQDEEDNEIYRFVDLNKK